MYILNEFFKIMRAWLKLSLKIVFWDQNKGCPIDSKVVNNIIIIQLHAGSCKSDLGSTVQIGEELFY